MTVTVLAELDPHNPGSDPNPNHEFSSQLRRVTVTRKQDNKLGSPFLITCDWGWSQTVVAEVPYLRWAHGVALAVAQGCKIQGMAAAPVVMNL